jgi:hypothetical protein
MTTSSRIYRVVGDTLVPLVPGGAPAPETTPAPSPASPSLAAQDAIQRSHEYNRAISAALTLENLCEMAGRDDLAREARAIRSRLTTGQ